MSTMTAKVLLPSGVLLEREVAKVQAESPDGSFGLLPNHIDLVTSLAPSILVLTDADDTETLLAVDEGVLVKKGRDVLISTRGAVVGRLGELKDAVAEQFRELSDREIQARAALDRLEAGMASELLRWED